MCGRGNKCAGEEKEEVCSEKCPIAGDVLAQEKQIQ